MINRVEAVIPSLVIHQVGNKANHESIFFSDTPIIIEEEQLMDHLCQYFLDGWKETLSYVFTFHDNNLEHNPMYQYAQAIFKDPNQLYEQSKHIARHLYERSDHVNIKSGDLMVAYIESVMIEDELLDAIAIFKAENKDVFLKLLWDQSQADVAEEVGIPLHKIDKACLIFNRDAERGYHVLSVDRSNKGQEAQFWKEQFLNVKEKSDDFYYTQQYMKMTKSFVKERLAPLEDLDKSEEAAHLFRSKEYFEKNESFSKEDFQETVFKTEKAQQAFNDFVHEQLEEDNQEVKEHFSVSVPALKKNQKVFKSVIKLDKNFHIYVHGDRRLIERGEDPDGKKFYKIYFDSES